MAVMCCGGQRDNPARYLASRLDEPLAGDARHLDRWHDRPPYDLPCGHAERLACLAAAPLAGLWRFIRLMARSGLGRCPAHLSRFRPVLAAPAAGPERRAAIALARAASPASGRDR